MPPETAHNGSAAARLWARGTVGIISLVLSVLACYGLLALTVLLPLIGVRLVLDETTWAAAIAALALQCGSPVPLARGSGTLCPGIRRLLRL